MRAIAFRFRSRPSAQDYAIQPERFGERPCLERASLRRVRSIALRNFRQVTDAVRVECLKKRYEKTTARLLAHVAAARSYPCFDECAHQIRPHCALMIGSVAGEDAPAVLSSILRIVRRKRAEARRGQQFLFRNLHDPARPGAAENLKRQAAHREQSVWAYARVDARGDVIAIHHVVEIARVLVPELRGERLLSSIGPGRESGIDLTADAMNTSVNVSP